MPLEAIDYVASIERRTERWQEAAALAERLGSLAEASRRSGVNRKQLDNARWELATGGTAALRRMTGAQDLYGRSKIAGEEILREASGRGLKTAALRLFNVYGSLQTGNRGHFLPAWVAQARGGRPLEVHGDGSQTVDLTHVSDVARAFDAMAFAPLGPGEHVPINFATGVETSIHDVAQRVSQEFGVTVHRNASADIGRMRRAADLTQVRTRFGLKARPGRCASWA